MHTIIESVVKKASFSSVLLLILMAFTQPLFALEYECSSGADKRFIRMELPGIEHLCEVSVTYANGERKVMWYANNDSSFCSVKTDVLQKKYVSSWNFQCEQWPDHDGVDQLSERQRTILDTELKALTNEGKNGETPFLVKGLKAAASPAKSNGDDVDLLVVQFFLNTPNTNSASDVTHIIRDEGDTWSTMAKIDSLANYIEVEDDYIIDSALLSSVTGSGALEVTTMLDSISPSNGEINTDYSGCYGNQILATGEDGELIAKTPHRYYCPDKSDSNAG